MSEESLVGGKVNVEKYMSLLQSENDLKIKLQQLFLKMKKAAEEDKAEIARLTQLLSNQSSNSSSEKGDTFKLSAEVNSLKMDLATVNSKLKNCRTSYINLEQDLQDKETQVKALKALNATKKSASSSNSIKTVDTESASKKAVKKKVSVKKSTSTKDDLTLISGVGPKLKEKLYKEGITHFEQIAAWKAADIREFDDKLSFKGRIKRDEWVKQAKALMKK